MVFANDTITLHHLFVTPGVELLIYWHWLGERVAVKGGVHRLGTGRTSSFSADIGEEWRLCAADVSDFTP